jgi:hypothetical protein
MDIYLVRGRIGDYEDRVEWIVGAFYEKSTAERLVSILGGIVSKYENDPRNERYTDDYDAMMEEMHSELMKHDDDFLQLYEFPRYSITECEVRG